LLLCVNWEGASEHKAKGDYERPEFKFAFMAFEVFAKGNRLSKRAHPQRVAEDGQESQGDWRLKPLF